MGLFQQTLQSVLQLYPVAGQLVLSAHHGAPQSLFGIGHKAQGQLLGHKPLHQSLFLGAVRFWTRPFTSEHSLWSHHRGFNRSAFAVHGLQFYEDGRKIALYANTLPGFFFLREEVV